jgi:hypothetical protein
MQFSVFYNSITAGGRGLLRAIQTFPEASPLGLPSPYHAGINNQRYHNYLSPQLPRQYMPIAWESHFLHHFTPSIVKSIFSPTLREIKR